ncbi:uncharacterized protein Z519_01716 [Cladophialophora bantiana CBS 173.52]|uniref:Unplaced genomic scaffold supercont1.2, whole genome shotgun sequence n=1 Tax=Cladophialophora bantiana (strain ATCC 10958 / CBS 173.52 / CDC B-1940 / NIH 8579) TaxID=1442370 RepID=A0A0D2GIE1_CLAB1|nr:uncharacterized protein Z519_01716 [Cladophialophora bantiana CBS 173.52]KIW98132.1 hypothetical protein Z519_01716 [Cladophialophora bantiana CBS 173.52]
MGEVGDKPPSTVEVWDELPNLHRSQEPAHVEETTREDHPRNGAILLDVGAKCDVEGFQRTTRLAKDEHSVVVPQPSDDAQDPLNWSASKKHRILITLAVAVFMADFQATSGVPCLIPQSAEWHTTPNHVNYSGNLNIIMAQASLTRYLGDFADDCHVSGIGGILGIPALYFWGRALVAFWSILISIFLQLGCARVQSFNTFYALRALVGLTSQPALTAGLAFIQDMFFFYEHARKIGVWAAIFLIAPYFSPLLGNFIVAQTGSWRIVQWLPFAVGGANILMMAAFLDETRYRRDIQMSEQPDRGARLLRILGVWQIRVHHHYFDSVRRSCMRIVEVAIKPIMVLVFIYYMAVFIWLVGINQTSSILFATARAEGGYGFGQNAVGFLFFAPIAGIIAGEIFGHFFNDYIFRRSLRRHKGLFVPEYCLPTIYVGLILMFLV